MTPEDLQEFIEILRAHERTVDVCQACAETTGDLAAEVKRGAVRAELRRLMASLGVRE